MNTLEEMMTLHICILVGWQIPTMFTLTLPSHALSLEDINNESWYLSLFLVKHRHGLKAFQHSDLCSDYR